MHSPTLIAAFLPSNGRSSVTATAVGEALNIAQEVSAGFDFTGAPGTSISRSQGNNDHKAIPDWFPFDGIPRDAQVRSVHKGFISCSPSMIDILLMKVKTMVKA